MQPSNLPLDAIRPEIIPPVTTTTAEYSGWEQREEAKRRQSRLHAAHTRDLEAKGRIHKAILANIRLASFCLGGAIVIRTLHLLLPLPWMWLQPKQLEALDTLAKFAITGALGSLLSRYLNKNTSGGENNEKPPQ